MEKERNRNLMLYEFKCGHSAAAATRNICRIEGAGTVKESTCRRWFAKFRTGEEGLRDKNRSGRPLAYNLEDFRQTIEGNPRTSVRRLETELLLSKSTYWNHLHRIGKANRRARKVPRELTAEQKQRRIDLCRQLRQNAFDGRFYGRIITCDEKWIFFQNPDHANQWITPGQPALPVPKINSFGKKVMLSVWWNSEGMVHFEMIPNGRSITAALYCQQLDRVQESLRLNYPALVSRNQVVFLQDNAKPHTALLTKAKLDELGWEVLSHPPYSPDLAPSDYHLFRSMEHFLRGREFEDIDQVETACQEFFNSKEPIFYRRGIELSGQRWLEVVDNNGEYLV
jgi:histone-lysine N-methyltransferase SETMAR